MVEHLIGLGASVNEKDAYGDSPLHYACFCGHADVVELLMDRGADPMRVSADGKTPVQSAQEEGHSKVVELLKRRGASLATPTGATSGPAAAAPLGIPNTGKGSSTRRLIFGLDFSVGVVLEGELRKKRANKLQKWRRKYYVMSATYGALFFWTGTADSVTGVVKKVRFETFFAVRHFPDKQGGKRFDIKVLTGRTMQLLADSPELALRWVQVLREQCGRVMGALRIQTAWRGHVARHRLRDVKEMRSRIVAKAGAAAASSGASSSAVAVLMEGALKKKNSSISASLLSAFRTRYFVLDVKEGCLLYYKSKAVRNMGEAPARIPIVSFLSVQPIHDRKGAPSPRFLLRVTAGRVFTFEAPSADEAERWTRALQRAMPRDNIAAICVQRHVRGHLARRLFTARRADVKARSAAVVARYAASSGLPEERVVTAVIAAQALMRGHRDRKVANHRALVRRRAAAASSSRLYLKSHRRKAPAAEGEAAPARSKGQESRMQRLMRLRAAKEAKAGKAGSPEAAAGGASMPPPPPPPPAAAAAWTAHTDASSGRTFWSNDATGETTWTDPALPRFGDWVAITDDDGDTFYTNEVTGESQWEAPPEVAAAKAGAAAEAAPPAPAASGGSPAPDWVAQRDPEDGTFYARQSTGESQWEKPEGFDEQFPPAGRCAVWTRVQDDDGDVFYTDNRTGEARWDRPKDFDGDEGAAAAAAAAGEEEAEEGFDPSQWTEQHDPVSNKRYWFNPDTGDSRWSVPDGMAERIAAAAEDDAEPAAAAASASSAGSAPGSPARRKPSAASGSPARRKQSASGPAPAASPSRGGRGAAPTGEAPPDPAEILTFSSWVNDTLSSTPGQLTVDGAEGAAAAAVGWLSGRLPLDLDEDPPALFTSARNGVLLAKLVNAVATGLGGDAAVDERALEVDVAPRDDGADDEDAGGNDDLFFFANAATDPSLENAQLALSAARAAGAMVPADVTAQQVTAGRPGAVLDMVWALWKRSLTHTVSVRARPEAVCLLDAEKGEELADLMRLKPETLLVRWLNYQLDLAEAWDSDSRCSAFGPDLADGRMLSAVVRQLCTDPEHQEYLPSDSASRDAMSTEDLAGNTIWVASRLGVPEWFSVEAISSGNVRLQIAFVAMLWQRVHGSMGESTLPQLSRRRRSSAVVRRRTMDGRGMMAVQRELATMIREEEGDAEAETITRETRVQRQWINSLNLPGVAVHDLASDVRDGVVLLRVVDRIEPGLVNWKRAHAKPRNRYQHVENCNNLLRVCKAMELTVVNLSGPDIAAGNPKLVAAVVWQLLRHHTLRILSSVAFSGFDVSEAQILEWANSRLPDGERIASFADSSLASCVPLLRVLHSVRPVVDWDLVTAGRTEADRKSNALYLLSVARKMGAAVFCAWEDIVEVKPKMIMTLLASAIVVDQKLQGGAAALARARTAVAGDVDEDEDDELDRELLGAKARVAAVAEFGADSDDEDGDE